VEADVGGAANALGAALGVVGDLAGLVHGRLTESVGVELQDPVVEYAAQQLKGAVGELLPDPVGECAAQQLKESDGDVLPEPVDERAAQQFKESDGDELLGPVGECAAQLLRDPDGVKLPEGGVGGADAGVTCGGNFPGRRVAGRGCRVRLARLAAHVCALPATRLAAWWRGCLTRKVLWLLAQVSAWKPKRRRHHASAMLGTCPFLAGLPGLWELLERAAEPHAKGVGS